MKVDYVSGYGFAGETSVYDDVYPADFVASRQLDDPLVVRELMGLVQEAELMGIDLDDPEIMGAWLKNLINKVKSAVKKKKKVKVAAANITTDAGSLAVSPQGVSWTDAQPESAAATPIMPIQSASMASMMKNPLVIGAGVGLLALMLMKKKKGGRR